MSASAKECSSLMPKALPSKKLKKQDRIIFDPSATNNERLLRTDIPNSLTNQLNRLSQGLPLLSARASNDKIVGKSRKLGDYFIFCMTKKACPLLPIFEQLLEVGGDYKSNIAPLYINPQDYREENSHVEINHIKGNHLSSLRTAAGVIIVQADVISGYKLDAGAQLVQNAIGTNAVEILSIRGDWWQRIPNKYTSYTGKDHQSTPNIAYDKKAMLPWANAVATSINKHIQ